jgi:hypothetical protein
MCPEFGAYSAEVQFLIDQVTNLVSGKLALRYSGSALDAMKAVALAAKARSLADFQVLLSLDND